MSDSVISALLERRSVRKYISDRMPDQSAIDTVIKAGLYAASGKGMQSQIILAVTRKDLRDRLAEMNRRIGGFAEGMDPFYGAPVVLVVLAKRSVNTHVYDGALTIGNMMLAAHALGLGSCWIHRAREEFDSDEGRQILAEAGILGDYEGIGHCILGYPDGPLPAAAERKDGRVFFVR